MKDPNEPVKNNNGNNANTKTKKAEGRQRDTVSLAPPYPTERTAPLSPNSNNERRRII